MARLDRDSPQVVEAFRSVLARPADIVVVEHIESLAKRLWSDVLDPSGRLCEQDAIACGDFFSRLGFLYKYKPYGVKIASPFGYSVFDLNDGQGFSFQLHVEPKLEGFHILRPKDHSLVYISSREEWLNGGELWAHAYLSERKAQADPPFVWRPGSGDVIEISTTEVVHSVLGCVLEEYASCSVDAVERLWDQNQRSKVNLPAEHPEVSRLLGRGRQGLPTRRIQRTSIGWDVMDWSDTDAAIEVKGDLWGSRVRVFRDHTSFPPGSEEMLKIIVAVDHGIEVKVARSSRRITRGEFVCVLPGVNASISSLASDSTVAMHCVSRALVQADWSR